MWPYILTFILIIIFNTKILPNILFNSFSPPLSQIERWVEGREKKSDFKQISSFKRLLRKRKVREELVGYLSGAETEGYNEISFVKNSIEFWKFSQNSQLFSEREREWIREVNEEVEKRKKKMKEVEE